MCVCVCVCVCGSNLKHLSLWHITNAAFHHPRCFVLYPSGTAHTHTHTHNKFLINLQVSAAPVEENKCYNLQKNLSHLLLFIRPQPLFVFIPSPLPCKTSFCEAEGRILQSLSQRSREHKSSNGRKVLQSSCRCAVNCKCNNCTTAFTKKTKHVKTGVAAKFPSLLLFSECGKFLWGCAGEERRSYWKTHGRPASESVERSTFARIAARRCCQSL